ncbi:MAG: cobyrinate a,c-diamide synthase [Roseitalea sp.]|jgi:cobyrinic acid a,c-diamide synthase|nr:cobyrinate a,c-diamide synthase [Roseitalea sp.]MBO6721315.1 cobyrinate a,c-diamide synthase [Roseitalea sp.]MBO6742200.1 cobyrinate a,c-diamide synthase [Roseitalea sp.]
MNGFLVAAPHSGSGKTVVTLGLLRALRDAGHVLAPAKAGPDYIDPAFHAAASGETCINLDPWAMRPALLRTLAASHGADRLLVTEAMMGLFDGAADGTGSAADLGALLGLPVVFVVDASRMAQSIAALVSGYRGHRPDLLFASVILNRVGSPRHEKMLRAALDPLDVPVLGVVPHDTGLALPERHLGLVQAGEHAALEPFIAHAGMVMARCCDLEALACLPGPSRLAALAPQDERGELAAVSGLPPLGQRIAIARDVAFAFAYPHLLDGWRGQGAELSFFSPLSDEAPEPDADAVFLPGGYPELHAGAIAGATRFKIGMEAARDRGAVIYGECGGYMVLGEGLTDADGAHQAMLGFLPVETSFATRTRHLGYRRLDPLPGAPWPMKLTAHEFHYATVMREGDTEALFAVRDAQCADLGQYGRRVGTVSGSWCHVIDRVD